MNLTLHIVKKDLRRLWPLLLAWCVVLVLEAVFPALMLYFPRGPLLVRDSENFSGVLLVILELALMFMIATRLIETDLPLSDKVFWRTLPVTGRRMFGAKGLFALLFLILPLILFTLATRMIYGFPLAEWFDGLAPYANGHVGLVALALTMPSLFRRPFLAYIGLAFILLGLEISAQYFLDPVSWALLGPRRVEIILYSVLFAFMCLFIGWTLYLRDQPRLTGVLLVAAWALWCGAYAKLIFGWDGDVFAYLNTLRGEMEWLPLVVGGVATCLLMYMRFKRHQGALILLSAFFAVVNLIARWPVPDLAPKPAHELLQLPPGETITASGVTDMVQLPSGTLTYLGPNQYQYEPQLAITLEPELRFESQSSGNLSIFNLDKAWFFDYSTASIRWPNGTTIDTGGSLRIEDLQPNPSVNLYDVVNALVTGRPVPNATQRQVEMNFKLPVRDPIKYARLQREPAVIEGEARYTLGSFEKIADFPLVNGATYSTGTTHSVLRSTSLGMRQQRPQAGEDWPVLSLNVAILSPSRIDRVYYDNNNGILGDFENPALLFALWNPTRQEAFLVGVSGERGPALTNAYFLGNGVPFYLASFSLAANLYQAPSNSNNNQKVPLSPADAKAWLDGARLLAYRFTPHPYYLPFKTEPFILQATPPAAP